ncbi:SPOR domain-containing protein [Croceivirga thetidis]|uniref:SPOR domain-containing protein n=1 Tax=Croceivirga thetidis TaxID=2721623 RepID=A0ABX1GNV5_9FLAO|nr:SPOR domain-containing protein [Croceivirga thetidis]NKI30645.1 SPOR domain-containing protein [Croceivirga thetidis]
MRTTILVLLTLLFCCTALAQEGTISVEQDQKMEQLLSVYNRVNKQREYYQIQVGFGTAQKAEYLKSKVDVEYPGWFSKIDFEEPTFRVKLGKFYDLLEAERRFQLVRKKYPNAMLIGPINDKD